MRSPLLIAALLVALPAGALDIEWVYVGDPGNPPDSATNCLDDTPDCGSVPYAYRISKYEVTNAQYVEFLNAVAATDAFGLYSTAMASEDYGNITQTGSSGSYSYAVKPGFESKPVIYVSWYDAARFANWLHNGQPIGPQGPATTEDGAYTFTGLDSVGPRNGGALEFLPTESEWYKAAYFDPGLPGYYDWPTGTDALPTCSTPSAAPNTMNCYPGSTGLTEVGAYTGSPSPDGTFDQGGNVYEWNETTSDSFRGLRGGGWRKTLAPGPAAWHTWSWDPFYEFDTVGFRVASVAPEPAEVLLVLTGGLVLAAARRQRRA